MADTQRKLEAWLSLLGCSRHMVRGGIYIQHCGPVFSQESSTWGRWSTSSDWAWGRAEQHVLYLRWWYSSVCCVQHSGRTQCFEEASDYLKAFVPAFYLQEYPFSKTWDHPLSEYSGVRPGGISLTPNVYRFVPQVPSHERVFSVSSVCFPSSLHSQGLYAFSWASPILTRLDPHTSHSVSSSGSLCSWLKAIKTLALLQWPTTGNTKDIEKYTKSRERFKNTSQHGNQLALAMGQNTRSISFLRQVEAACPPVWRLVWSYELMYSVALYKRMAPWKQSTRYARSTACCLSLVIAALCYDF